MDRPWLLALLWLLALPWTSVAHPAWGQVSDEAVRIGLLTDVAGVYSDISGMGAVTAAEMAIEDFGGRVLGRPIELLFADHHNKADIASLKTREWFDVERVDMVIVSTTSSAALAAQEVGRQKNRVILHAGPATSRLTNEDCSPVGIQWGYDTYALAVGTARTVLEQGGDSWFFLTVDYAYGHSLEADVRHILEDYGGTVLGSVSHPFPTTDFSSFLLQAQASGAKVIALANAGQDTINSIKQAKEFGITEAGQQLVGLLVFLTDVHALGIETAQGLILTTPFYWDYDEASRAWSSRYEERQGRMPTLVHAGVYSAIGHYLRAVEAAGSDEADAVIAKMKELPLDDFFARNGYIREDGRAVNDLLLVQVKSPDESQGPWDYYKVIKVIPGEEAFRPLAESVCPMIN